ncbi:MAG: D-amino-acid transaminase [Rhodospirillales bacterium]|nr:D-amino-acid transaminase [Rhodospirillales bacterium]
MSRIAYVNGRYLPQRHAAVNIEDRGYQFADGIYEVIYVNGGRTIDAGLHLDRLERSMRELRLPAPMGRAALETVLAEVARRNRVRDGLIYMQVTRGVARRDHPFPNPAPRPALVVTARRLGAYPAAPDAWAVGAITAPDQRWARCDIKTVGLTANVLARQAAREAGAAEAILVNDAGDVTEGAATSVWVVDATGTLRTRPLDHAILPGCTRGALIALLAAEGIRFEERGVTLEELRAAREIFLTSASSFVKPVVRLDGAKVADGVVGAVTRRLFDLFARHVKGDGRND